MKNLFLSILFLGIINVSGQEYFLAAPQGYGAAATGGGNNTPVTVTTFAELKTNLVTAGARVILVSGEITIPFGQPISAVVVNKTLIGLPGAKLINENQSNPGAGILYLKNGSNNVIIRNLVFVGPGAYDIDGQDNLTADGCTNLWVDHCEFQDGQDGNFDIKGLSDNVSVSWCKFTYLKPPVAGGSGGSSDHRFSNRSGSSASNAPADGHYSVTFQDCYWASGCKDRMPRARNAELHMLNCYYNVGVSGSKAIHLGGGTNNTTCYVENCHFANVVSRYSLATSDGGTVAINFVNCLNQGSATDAGTVSPPSYTYDVIPVGELESHVTDTGCGAGATLQVDASGNISPGVCSSMGVEEVTQKGALHYYPTMVEDTLKLELSDAVTGKVALDIFAVNGQKVISLQQDVSKGNTVNVNVDFLRKGIYFCRLSAGSAEESWKFVKK